MRNMSEAETKVRIAKRVAEMLPDGGFVNLGVGIPTMAVDYLPADKHIYIQTENGMLGVGPKQLSGEAIIPNLINASRTPLLLQRPDPLLPLVLKHLCPAKPNLPGLPLH